MMISEWAESQGLVAGEAGFADKLKHAAMTALGFVVTESDAIVLANSLKEDGEITTAIPEQSVLYTIDGRKYLQLFGTEAHRDIFDTDFWVNALLPTPHSLELVPAWVRNFKARCQACGAVGGLWGYDPADEDHVEAVWVPCQTCGGSGKHGQADIACVTDVRFENEAERIHLLGGENWWIDRPFDVEADDHASEVKLPDELIDVRIDNSGTLDQFRDLIFAACHVSIDNKETQ
jgi:hypothetical protein